MWKYLVNRFLLMFPTLLGVALLTFVLIRVIPGDVVELRYAGDRGSVSQDVLEKERARFGLDRPLWRQFTTWVLGDARGAPGGLHPHRACQGPRAAPDPRAARAEERDAARAHGRRARVRLPHRRPRGHRAGVQSQRARAALRAGGRAPRLHAHPGPRHAGGRLLHRRELSDGRRLRVDRPAHPVPVTWGAPIWPPTPPIARTRPGAAVARLERVNSQWP